MTTPGSRSAVHRPSARASWIIEQAQPIELSPRAMISGLLKADPVVLGMGASVRTARELIVGVHAALRTLVLHGDVRAVAIEGTETTAPALDRYVTQGVGDPVALLRSSQGFLRNNEALEIIEWIRTFNLDHAQDPLRVVYDDATAPDPGDVESIERRLARRDLDWHERTGQRIVHWGGIAHLVVGDPRTLHPYQERQRAAGADLRDALGDGYVAVAMTIGYGAAPGPLPRSPAAFTESVFEHVAAPVVLLDLKANHGGAPVIEHWLDSPLKTRCLGPGYDPARAGEFYLDAGPLRQAIDYLFHFTNVTPASSFA